MWYPTKKGNHMGVYEAPVWQDPPEKPSRRYQDTLAPLMDSPGNWAEIGEYASPESAYQAMLCLRKRQYRIPAPEANWEFLAHDDKVSARFLGE